MNSAVVEGMSEEHRGFFRDVWHFRVARKIPIVCGNIIYSYTVPNLQPQLYQQRHEGNASGVGAASKLDSSLHLRRRHHRFSARQ